MVLTKQRYTFEQWLEMPDDGRRYELLNGELVEMAPPTANHALLIAALHAWLLRARNAGLWSRADGAGRGVTGCEHAARERPGT